MIELPTPLTADELARLKEAATTPARREPLKFKIKAAPMGAYSTVEMEGVDISGHLVGFDVSASVHGATELRLTFINVEVEMDAEPEVVLTDGDVPPELASMLLP